MMLFRSFFAKYKPYYVANLKLAIPVVVSQMGHTLVALSDNIIMGRTGTIPLAACSLGNSIFAIFLVAGLGMSHGVTPLIAQERGKENYQECGKLLSNTLWVGMVVGLLLFLLNTIMVILLQEFKQVTAVTEQCRPFLFLLGTSIIPLMIFQVFRQFAEGLGFTKQAMMISIMGNTINIGVGITLVFGLFGIKAMGIKGLGYSALIDRTIMSIAMASYVLRSPKFKPYLSQFVVTAFDYQRIKKILKNGIPVSFQYLFEVSAFSSAAILIGWLGIKELAAHQIALSLAATTYMMATGIGAAATIQTGTSWGAKNYTQLRYAAIGSYHIIITFMIMCSIIFVFANRFLPSLYINDSSVIELAATLLIIAALFQLSDGIQVVGLGILRGMSDVKIPTMITLVAYWGIGLPSGYWMAFHLHMGAQGVWYGLSLGLLVSASFLFIRFNHLSKDRRYRTAYK